MRLLTFLTACCGASRCAVAVAVAVAEKANKPNVLRIIIFAVRRIRINISTVASQPVPTVLVAAAEPEGGGFPFPTTALVRHQMHVVYLGVRISHACLAETRRQNQADKLRH